MASLLLLAALPAAAEPPYGLRLPLDCRPGADCWILRHVDHDPGPGARDYRCGGLSGDQHRGTDFAIRDLGAMAQGVPVRAAAAGVVEGLRDGVPDVSVEEGDRQEIEGVNCGNGVRLAHGDGWITMYCHMRRGSIMVREGDRVEAGQQIGLVGLSGDTSFPHLHFDLRQGERIVDPFVGLERTQECTPGQRPFWREDVLADLVYQPVLLTAMGVAPSVPERADVRRGYHDETSLSALSPALVVWAEAYWVEAGDRLSFQLVGPDLRPIFERDQKIERAHTSWFGYAGERRPEDAWPAGSYVARVVLRRDTAQRIVLEERVVVD